MPQTTEHAPKVSTRSVNPYARESSREKRQQETHRRIVQKHFSRRFEGCTSRSYLGEDFVHDANTSMGHGSNTSRVGVYGPITTRGTLADRFILRGTKVFPLCRLLPTC